jgi:hypothetical protein
VQVTIAGREYRASIDVLASRRHIPTGVRLQTVPTSAAMSSIADPMTTDLAFFMRIGV